MRAPFCEFVIWLLLNFKVQFICLSVVCCLGREREGKETYEDVGHDVVGLPAHRTDAQAVAPGAIHAVHGNVIPARDGHAVILVDDGSVGDERVVARADIEAI